MFWRESHRSLTFSDLRELEKTTGWKKTTIQTHMLRLRNKGAIEEVPGYEKRGDVAHYRATMTEQDYLAGEGESILGRLFGGSAAKLVVALRQGGKLTKEDIRELKEYFTIEEVENE
jgi:BlaI family penicillinase repressor